MFAPRFLRPSFRTATRSFSTATRAHAPVTFRQAYRARPFRTIKTSTSEWQYTFRQSQNRGYARQAFNYQRFQASRSLLRRWAAQPTFYLQVGGIGVLCGGYYIMNMEAVPVSGRMRFNVISADFEKAQGEQMYKQVLQEYGKQIMPAQAPEVQMVHRVLERLIPHSGIPNDDWEVFVIDDDMKNAFVIPGGKVFVFRGILDVCQGDDGLAAVLGHEIAHNLAHHAAERMSQFVWLLPIGIIVWLGAGVDPGIIQFFSSLAFTLPGSRKQEQEADYIGLMMMAESCYNPEAAVGLWSRMEKGEQGAPPQFLSTHPSSHNRMETIRRWLPDAEMKYENSDCRTTSGYADDFRRTFDMQRW